MTSRDSHDQLRPEERQTLKARLSARRRMEAERDKASLSTTLLVIAFIAVIVGFAVWMTRK